MARDKVLSMPSEAEKEEWTEEQRITDDAEKGLPPLEESKALNKLLLRNARQSPKVIEQKTGIPADEVAERLTALLNNPDWRDDLMEEKLLLAEVAMLVEDIRNRMDRHGMDDEAWASMARVQLASIRTLLEQVEKRRKAIDGQLSVLTLQQAQLFAEAIRIAKERAVLSIQKEYPELDPERIHAAFEDELPRAIEFLEGQASG